MKSIKIDRHQLYVLAAHATFAEDTEINLKPDKDGKLIMAMKPKKADHRGVQPNGWVYYEFDKGSNPRLLTMEEAKKR